MNDTPTDIYSSSPETNPRLVAVYFSDVVGASALTKLHGDRIMAPLINEILVLQKEVIELGSGSRAGRFLKSAGDSVLASFDLPSTAMARALRIQKALEKWRRDNAARPQISIRIGVHIGEVNDQIGKRIDIVGHHLNLAQRLMSLADGNQIYVTSSVWESGRDGISREYSGEVLVQHHGHYVPKGVGMVDVCEIYDRGVVKGPCPPADTSAAANVHHKVADRGYVDLAFVGEGATGLVYRAKHKERNEWVALKVLKHSAQLSPAAINRFEHEALRLRSAQAAGTAGPPTLVPWDDDRSTGRHLLHWSDALRLTGGAGAICRAYVAGNL